MRPAPSATYRIQFHPGFTFDDAAACTDYLARLGVSHLYASPYLQAVKGSAHGYDVVDPTRVNSDLGGSEAHARLCRSLEQAGLGQILDVVPNHMAIAGRQNPWWWDVLENGPSSHYATYFDVDWAASEERWPNKVLLPLLGDHYGRVLEAGELRLAYNDAAFTLHYFEHAFPIDPSSLEGVLRKAAETCGSEFLVFLADSFASLPRPTVTGSRATERRHRNKPVLAELLMRLYRENPAVAAAIDAEVSRINADPDALDELVDNQNYRLAYWRTGDRDLGYRRFFNINTLVGMRVEGREVFRAAHGLPISWAQEGLVHGLRIDHVDGLRDPAEYFQWLHEACPDAWVVGEKILASGETLRPDWRVAGTTGYDFLNGADGLFIDPNGEEPLTRLYADFTSEPTDFHAVVYACKRQVLNELLGSELNRLTALFVSVCERHRRHRDYTSHDLYEALCEVAACFPVYRTYVRASGGVVSEADITYITEAVQLATAQRADMDPELFRFLGNLLLLRITGSLEGELAMRFQQVTGPAMAKGVEDTAFYRFNRLVSLNEVGGNPGRFGTSLEEFHQACAATSAGDPLTLLATSTHDTKRSEDVRARLALLTEIPEPWSQAVRRWASRNARFRHDDTPDRNMEYLFYQTLVGAWPISVERMTAYMEKAAREAKVRTSWNKINEAYEGGLRDFVRTVMDDREFRADFEDFVGRLIEPGRINSLALTIIKLTAPGVPDIYQGSEVWNLSLVDPDNRRPVGFAQLAQLLADLEEPTPEEVMARADEGLPKLWVTRQALWMRRERPAFFGPQGSYHPLEAKGAKARHVVAFMRGKGAVTVAPRLVMGLGGDWADTVVALPNGRWHNVLTDEEIEGGAVRLAEILARFPVGLVVREES